MKDNMQSIIKELIAFRNERDWEQFHSPKNLACSISIEAGELLELFQWTDYPITSPLSALKSLYISDKLKEEIADISIYLIYLAHHFDIDLIQAIKDKIEKNRQKYPVHKAKGNSVKYDEL